MRSTDAGTPQGSILSPLLSNVALSVLDEHIAQAPGGPTASPSHRATRRRHGLPNYRLVRFADDWCLTVSGTRADAEALREEIAVVLSGMGLRLSAEKTLITHIDEGLDFLGWHIQRRRKPGTTRYYVYTYPAKKAIASITGKVKALCWQNVNLPLAVLLHQLNSVLRGWCALLPPRRVSRGLPIPARLHLAAGLWVAAPKAPPEHLEADPSPLLRRRLVASRRRGDTVQPGQGTHQLVPIPGHEDPLTVARGGLSGTHQPNGACGEPGAGTTGTPGSGGGPGKPTDGNTGRAPWSDLTSTPSAGKPSPRCAPHPAPAPTTTNYEPAVPATTPHYASSATASSHPARLHQNRHHLQRSQGLDTSPARSTTCRLTSKAHGMS
jgi:hypothetical protein